MGKGNSSTNVARTTGDNEPSKISLFSPWSVPLDNHTSAAQRAGLRVAGPLSCSQRAVTSPLLTAPVLGHQGGTVPRAAAGSAAGSKGPHSPGTKTPAPLSTQLKPELEQRVWARAPVPRF